MFVDALFQWFDEVHPEGFAAEMSLRAGDRWVLGAHDGFPGPIHVRPDEFAILQHRLAGADLPRDLYYPILEQRPVIEPGEIHGGVVRQLRLYSPQEWAHRDAARAHVAVPSDEERRRRFAQACETFEQSLMLRMAELREPGRPVPPAGQPDASPLDPQGARVTMPALQLPAVEPGDGHAALTSPQAAGASLLG